VKPFPVRKMTVASAGPIVIMSITLLLVTSVMISVASEAYSATENLTATPIKHLVVIFQENISFDHYFATYPYAKNPNNNNLPSMHLPIHQQSTT
jgi:phospholipase C